jgi:hypothetical protein
MSLMLCGCELAGAFAADMTRKRRVHWFEKLTDFKGGYASELR